MVAGRLREVNGIYYVCLDWYENRKRKYKSFSTKIKVGEKGARKRAEELLLKARTELIPDKRIKFVLKNGVITQKQIFLHEALDKAIEYYLALNSLKPITIKQLQSDCNSFKKNIENIDITLLDEEFIENSLMKFTQKNVYQRYKKIYSKIIKYLLKKKMIEKNYLNFLENRKLNVTKTEILTEEELKKFLQVIKKEEFYLEFFLLTSLGLRISELLGLKESDIDFQEKSIKINRNVLRINKVNHIQETLKTKLSNRVLPLTDELIEEIKKRIKKNKEYKKLGKSSYTDEYDGFILVDFKGELIKYMTLNRHLKRILKENNLNNITLHGLRHSIATAMYSNDVDLKIIQHYLGHSSIQTTANIYTRYDVSKSNEIKNLLEKLNKK